MQQAPISKSMAMYVFVSYLPAIEGLRLQLLSRRWYQDYAFRANTRTFLIKQPIYVPSYRSVCNNEQKVISLVDIVQFSGHTLDSKTIRTGMKDLSRDFAQLGRCLHFFKSFAWNEYRHIAVDVPKLVEARSED